MSLRNLNGINVSRIAEREAGEAQRQQARDVREQKRVDERDAAEKYKRCHRAANVGLRRAPSGPLVRQTRLRGCTQRTCGRCRLSGSGTRRPSGLPARQGGPQHRQELIGVDLYGL
jgi:hypothetical protein